MVGVPGVVGAVTSVKLTVAVWVMVTVLVARKVAEPTAEDLTEKAAWPELLVVSGLLTTVAVPDDTVNETEVLVTKLLKPSFRVTVTVEVVLPFAPTELGLAETVEFEALTAPAVSVKIAFSTVAVILAVPPIAMVIFEAKGVPEVARICIPENVILQVLPFDFVFTLKVTKVVEGVDV